MKQNDIQIILFCSNIMSYYNASVAVVNAVIVGLAHGKLFSTLLYLGMSPIVWVALQEPKFEWKTSF
jgi:hypothetical protein